MKKEPHINDDNLKQAVETGDSGSAMPTGNKDKKFTWLPSGVSLSFVVLMLTIIIAFCLFGFAFLLEKMRYLEEEGLNRVQRVQHFLISTDLNLLKQQNMLDQEIKVVYRMQNQAQHGENIIKFTQIDTLIRMASQLLYFQQNTHGAISLLEEADKQLVELNNPEFRDFRAQITAIIGELKIISQLDIEGVLLRLNQLSTQVTTFPTLREERNTPSKSVPGLSEAAFNQLPAWKRGLLTSWEQLKSLVLIQYHENSVAKAYLPHNRMFSDQQLQTQLVMAQWAAMYRKESLYTSALNQAIRELTQNYLLDSPAVSSALAQLKQLAQIRLDAEYPDLQPLLQTLRDLESAQQNQPVSPATETKPMEQHVYSAFVKILPTPRGSA